MKVLRRVTIFDEVYTNVTLNTQLLGRALLNLIICYRNLVPSSKILLRTPKLYTDAYFRTNYKNILTILEQSVVSIKQILTKSPVSHDTTSNVALYNIH